MTDQETVDTKPILCTRCQNALINPRTVADIDRSNSRKTKYYAVARGRKPGVYTDWYECEEQVFRFSGPRFKSFPTLTEAQAFVAKYGQPASEDSSESV